MNERNIQPPCLGCDPEFPEYQSVTFAATTTTFGYLHLRMKIITWDVTLATLNFGKKKGKIAPVLN
jgi:hypothetical protein